jgi:hypothetical protein
VNALSRSTSIALLLAFTTTAAWPARAEWKPAQAPLMTRWAKDVTPEKALPEYPRPQLVRPDWLNLNGLWDYAITSKGAAQPEKWDGQILVPFCIESALSGVGKHVTSDQNLWYRRTIALPAGWPGKRILLHFEAVDWQATVFVNGKEIGSHKGGFVPFEFDITAVLKDGKGELVVRVWDPTDTGSQPRGKQVSKPSGIWYTPVTGIWQTVWMEPVPNPGPGPLNVTSVRFTPDVDKGEVEFIVEINEPSPHVWATVDVGNGVASIGAQTGHWYRLKIPKPHLWTPDDPYLYPVTVQLTRDHPGYKMREAGETVSSYFAMRKISVGKDEQGVPRLLLNNKPLFQLGPLDQGWWPDGLLTPPSDEAMAYDLKVIKQLGMNMLRKHIKVEPARYYYHCDKLGLLVWQDMPSGGMPSRKQFIAPNAAADATFTDEEKKQFRTELKAMIDHLRFFPCIVTWVPFNEGWGQHDTNEILEWVMKYDPSRLVDGPSGWADRGVGHMKDMHNYPGPGMFPVMKDRVSVLGEFGGLGLPLAGHLWKQNQNWGYRTYKTREELNDHYRALIVQLRPLIGQGLAAAVYTQTTDVETEVNGLMTYDREVIKLDVKETAALQKKLYGPQPTVRALVETAEQKPVVWRYAIEKPAEIWFKPEFDDSGWKQGEAGFGTPMTPNTTVRTLWKTDDIWVRRSFELKEAPTGDVMLKMYHDEDADVYINGVLAAKTSGFVTQYSLFAISANAKKALKSGKNVIAIHCHQTTGGQYIDAGLAEIVEPTTGK